MKKPKPHGSMEGPGGLKAFAKQLVSQYALGTDAARFSVVSFAADATTRVAWSINDIEISAGIDEMSADGKTSISDGFKAARQLFANHSRVGATKVVLLVSDGEQTVDAAPGKTLLETAVDAAALIKEMGVNVFAWGFGNKVSSATLERIATDPSKAILAQDLAELTSYLVLLEVAVCNDSLPLSRPLLAPPPSPPTPTIFLTITCSSGSGASEVGWSLACSDGTTLSGGAPYTSSVPLAVALGATCTLDMTDSYGDGWNGAKWEAPSFGKSFSLADGPIPRRPQQGTRSFVVQFQPSPPSPPSPPFLPPPPPLPPPPSLVAVTSPPTPTPLLPTFGACCRFRRAGPNPTCTCACSSNSSASNPNPSSNPDLSPNLRNPNPNPNPELDQAVCWWREPTLI